MAEGDKLNIDSIIARLLEGKSQNISSLKSFEICSSNNEVSVVCIVKAW